VKLHFAQKTERGLVRENNEDYFSAAGPFDGEPESKGSLFALADGLGGLAAGEVASREAVERLMGLFRGLGPEPFEDWLYESMQAVNGHIFRLNRARADDPMATTLTACHFRNGSLRIGHVGDCRVYRLRGSRVDCLTKDHSDGRRGLMRVIGIESQVAVDINVYRADINDVYLLCTDGLYGEISEKDMAEALMLDDPEETCRQLIRLSLDRGGYDNATAQVVRIDS
jgi:protein phosphatase